MNEEYTYIFLYMYFSNLGITYLGHTEDHETLQR